MPRSVPLEKSSRLQKEKMVAAAGQVDRGSPIEEHTREGMNRRVQIAHRRARCPTFQLITTSPTSSSPPTDLEATVLEARLGAEAPTEAGQKRRRERRRERHGGYGCSSSTTARVQERQLLG
uniref:Uncharacterized protein n=1 Tax=Oryza brachyantha TaxID=4533 RepID=J3LYK2_ORYBR